MDLRTLNHPLPEPSLGQAAIHWERGVSARGPRPCGATLKKTGIACTSTEASIDKLRGKQTGGGSQCMAG